MSKAKSIAVNKLKKWDVTEQLKTQDERVAYLEAALEDGDPALISAAIGDIARATGMTDVARKTGLARENLYTALSNNGNPEFATIMRVVQALGLRLHAGAG
jgi:probable addiction module antidote protein